MQLKYHIWSITISTYMNLRFLSSKSEDMTESSTFCTHAPCNHKSPQLIVHITIPNFAEKINNNKLKKKKRDRPEWCCWPQRSTDRRSWASQHRRGSEVPSARLFCLVLSSASYCTLCTLIPQPKSPPPKGRIPRPHCPSLLLPFLHLILALYILWILFPGLWIK